MVSDRTRDSDPDLFVAVTPGFSLQCDYLVRRIGAQRGVKLWEAASGDTLDGPFRGDFAPAALFQGAFCKMASNRTLVTDH